MKSKSTSEDGKNINNNLTVDEIAQDLEEAVKGALESRLSFWRGQETRQLASSQLNGRLKSDNSQRHVRAADKPPRKAFVARESLLTNLLDSSHIRALYNAFLGIFLIMFLQQITEEVMTGGRIDLKTSNLFWSFGELKITLTVIFCMNVCVILLLYVGFYLWANNRHVAPYLWDVIGGLVFALYIGCFWYYPVRFLVRYNLPPASSFALLGEQIRLLMKSWAFVRSNVRNARQFKKDDNHTTRNCPSFSQHLYFLFAPTLVYRDQYPRTNHCNWKKAAKDISQVLGCTLFMYFLLSRFCIIFEDFGKRKYTVVEILNGLFVCCFPGFVLLLCSFFLLLHSWMNAFAEVLRFADRQFYKDWWNSTSFPGFYRTWNCVVHDWLYEYIYVELTEFAEKYKDHFPLVKQLPLLGVFVASSIVHEYILSLGFKFFYPVLLVMFGGIGCLLMFVRTKSSVFNMFIWMSLILGMGILMCVYTVEWYARKNCLRTLEGFEDYLVPRSWFCQPGEEKI